jgi:1-acyl-sn-glycerol-3-phosphate acyltransferase
VSNQPVVGAEDTVETDKARPSLPLRQVIPWLVTRYLLRTVRVEADSKGPAIPRTGRMVCAFAPHCGWIDSIAIDECFRRVGRAWPTWLTKMENRDLPDVLAAGRVICMDPDYPAPRAMRAIDRVLAQPEGVLATALEGRRFGNAVDPLDFRSLGAFKLGPARFATRAQVPILPLVILGGERVAPMLDRLWRQHGAWVAYRAIQRCIADPQPIRVHALPLYCEHLGAEPPPRGKALGAAARSHTARLREILIAQIREIVPDYPVLDD